MGSVEILTLRRRWHRLPPALATSLLLVDADGASVLLDAGWLPVERGSAVVLAPRTATTLRVQGEGVVRAYLLLDGPPRVSRIVAPAFLTDEPRAAALRELLAGAPADAVTAHLARALILALGPATPASGDPVVDRALDLALADLTRRWSVDELARAVGLSRAAFSRRFRAALGAPPDRYLTRLRLEEAAARLVHTDAGLAGIAAAIGYASEFAFSRAFKRLHGVAPGRYRQRLRRRLGDAPRCLAA